MDPRLTLGLTSVIGAFCGAALMLGTAPSTGDVPMAAAPPPAAPDLGSLLAPAADAPPAEAAPAEAPPAAAPAEAIAPPPPPDAALPPPSVHPLRPQSAGSVVQPGGPYPSDVRGLDQFMRDQDAALKECMTKDGPAANPGESAVMLRFTITGDPSATSGAKVSKVEAPADSEGRYQYYVNCVSSLASSAPFQAPAAGTTVLSRAIRR